MKKLNVKRTNNLEIAKKWNLGVINLKGELFIRCNSKGVINWEIAPVFRLRELLIRGNVVILD